MAFAIAYYTTNANSVKTVTSAVNGGLDRICVCSSGQLRKRTAANDRQKSYLPSYYSAVSAILTAFIIIAHSRRFFSS